MAASAASPPLTSPRIYLVRMVVFLILVGFLAFVLYRQIVPAFMANPGLNGLILGVLFIAILLAFGQVQRLFREVRFVNRTAAGEQGAGEPRVVAALAPLVRTVSAGEPVAPSGFRPLLDTVASRLDEGREALRYIAGILILLGLLGTFWGLIDTLSAVGGVIRSMRAGGGDAAVMFDELKSGLAVPLSGIGLAFSASLFGLAGSLTIGFLDLQAGQAHNRFINQLEDWFASRAGPEAAAGVVLPARTSDASLRDLAEAVTRLSTLVGDSTGNSRSSTQAMANLAEGIQGLVQHMRAEQQMIRDWVEAQASRERELKQVLERLSRERVG
ncbi:flagellar motor protein MotA [Methylobacterium sp. ID0610]|uniref:flagellar motor protein MotA n=1 Tax=Methylobacterium carpenticola TaxID=3344827 RepID=UPI0036CBC4B9